MDYEKKYKEALNWMRSIYPTLTGSDKEDAEHYFPELKDSDDERIRKEIIHYILYDAKGVSEEQEHMWIAYLEKQKEQKKSLAERFRPDFPTVADFIESVEEQEKDKAIEILEDYLKWAVSESEEECSYTWNELANAIRLGIDAMKEQKTNIELIQKSWYMEGYHDCEFGYEPKWIIKTGEGGPRYEENPKYGQIIEQKPKFYPGDVIKCTSTGSLWVRCKGGDNIRSDGHTACIGGGFELASEEETMQFFHELTENGYQWDCIKGRPMKKEQKPAEQPMPDSTKLIELWHEDKEKLKEKDFRNDPWRLAYNAFLCGFGRGIAVNKQEQPEVEFEIGKYMTTNLLKKRDHSTGIFHLTQKDYATIARHFYELGFNARKEG